MNLSRWLQRLAGKALPARETRTQRLRRELFADLSVTRLETRRVLNGDGVASEMVIDAGDQAGDGQTDSFQIEINQDRIDVSVNGELIQSESFNQVHSIRIEGSDDNDLIDARLGDALSSGLQLSIHAGGGDDSVRIISQEQMDSLIHTISGSGTGTVELRNGQNASSLSYSGLERMDHQVATDQFLIDLGTGEQEVTVDDDPREGWTSIDITSMEDSSGETPSTLSLAFSNPNHELRVVGDADAGTDDDRIDVRGLDGAFDADFVFQGDESDSLSLSGDLDFGSGNVDVSAGNLSIEGTINAHGGSVELNSGLGGTTLVSGTIDVSDDGDQRHGGSVYVLGTHVGLVGHAFIDASGDAGGGVVLIGGDYQGGNQSIVNSARTVVGEHVVLAADAYRTGDGGKVIVWADEWTRFAGVINARGGDLSGNGGFAEVSGKQSLDFRGAVDLTAVHGTVGSLLLDPTNLMISDGDGTDNAQSADGSVLFADGGAVDFNITPASFEDIDANVTLQATADITIDSDITLSNASHTLAFQAGGNLIINASITSPGGANHLIFEADSIHQTGGADGTGTLTIANVTINSNGGDITLIAAGFAMTSLDAGDINAAAGNISIVETNGNVDPTIGATMTLAGGALTTGELQNFASTGTLTIGQATTSAGTTITAQTINQNSTALTVAVGVAGEVSFVAIDGFTLVRDLTTNQTTSIDADFDNDGTGSVTLGNNDDLDTSNSTLTITANDIIINTSSGSINSGTASTTIIDSDGDGIALGGTVVANGLELTAAELARISATGLTLETAGSIEVDGISEADSDSIAGTTTLTANGATSAVTFGSNASTFNALAVNASDGVNINADLTTDVGGITINADTGVADNDGTLTIASGVTVSTTDNSLEITADDLSLIGSVDTGAAATVIRDSDGSGIGFGDTVVADGLNITDSELDQITTTGLTLATAGDIFVNNLSQPGSVSGAITLTADGASSTVDFSTNASSFDTLVVNANEGVSVNADLSTTAGGITVNADLDADDNAGTFAVAASFTVDSAGNTIAITANDVDVAGAINSGASETTITDSDGTGIHLSATSITNGITLTGAELQNITATGLTASTSGSITVDNINAANSNNISGTTNLFAATEITFSGTESTFNALDARADDRITASVNITTDVGGLSLDGDADNTAGSNDDLRLADGIHLDSAGALTLDATTGLIDGAGALTLNAADGVTINDSLTTTGQLTIDADTGIADNNGVLTVASAAVVSTTDSLLDITADSLSLTGTLNAGNAATTLRDSDGTGIGFGATTVADGLNVSDADLDQITTAGLTLVTGGNIVVDSISQPGSVSGAITITADGASSTVEFSNNASSFDALAVNANEGVSVNVDLGTTVGGITVNADSDADDNSGTFSVAATFTVNSAGNAIAITANDINLAGNIDSGVAATAITDSDGTGIGLGDATVTDGINLTGAELQNLSATGMTASTAGSILVDNVTAANSNNVSGTLNLVAGTEITFAGAGSTFNTLDAQADDRITVSENIATDVGGIFLDGDADNVAGTNDDIQFADGVQLDSAQLLTLDATNGGIDGAGALTLNAADGVTINDSLTTLGQLTIDTDTGALATDRRLTIAAGAAVFTTDNLLDITANEISLAGTINTGVAATAIRDSDGDGIGFGDTTVSGGLNISDADLDQITATGLTLATAGDITVDNVSQPAIVSGAITLNADGATSTVAFSNNASSFDTLVVSANEGVSVNADLSTTSGGITVNADADADDNSGTFSVAATFAVNSAGNAIAITANDLDLPGNVDSGASATTITDSDGTGISLGDAVVANGVNLTGAELQNISATGLTASTAGLITVDNVTQANSNNVTGITTLVAATEITFSGTASTFNALDARADDRITVSVNITTDSGGLSLDGDADNAADTNDDLQIAAGIQLSSAGLLTLDATTGDIDGAGPLTLNAADGVTINDSLTTLGQLTINADTGVADDDGTLTIASGAAVISSDTVINVTANDADIQGTLSSGVAGMVLLDSDGSGIGLGNTTVADGLNLTGAELQRLTANGISLTTSGSITVNDITAANSNNLSGTTTFAAGTSVAFTGTASTFNALDVQADDRISVGGALSTDVGDLLLDGDADNAIDSNDDIQFSAGAQLTSAGQLILDATNGEMTGAGALALSAADGMTLNNSLTTSGQLTVNADTDAGDGVGTLTISLGADVVTGGSVLDITANDLNVLGSVDSGAASTTLRDSDGGGIGLGATTIIGGLNISDADLDDFTATGITFITTGDVVVDAITQPIAIAGTTTIRANGTTSVVAFSNNASVFGTLAVDSNEGVFVNADVSTNVGGIAINADLDANDNIGTFSVAAAAILNSGGNSIAIVANDIALDGAITSGAASTSMTDSDGTGIGLGDTAIPNGIHLTGGELQSVNAAGLTLSTGGPMIVNNITAANSNAISGTTSLVSGSSITFTTLGSVFNGLDARADNRISISANVTTDIGDLSLDGDADNSADGNDDIQIAVGALLTSAGLMTLDATTGNISATGALTLNANNGVTINDSLTTSGLLSINADTNAGDNIGTLTLVSGATLSTGNNLLNITVNDLDVQGSVNSGTSATTIQDSDGGGIGLGDTLIGGGLNISDADLNDFTANGLVLSTSGNMVVDNISQPGTISGTTTLDVGGSITFSGTGSTFNAISAQANDRISVEVNLVTTVGDMLLDGDANNVADTNDDIQFSAGVQLTSAGSMTLDATLGEMSAVGALTLNAADGVTLNDSLTTSGALTINADSDAGDGLGTFTVAAGVTVSTQSNVLDITTNDLDIFGSVSSGSASTTIQDSDGGGIGLGDATIVGGLNLSIVDLQDFTANGLTLTTAGNVDVDNMSQPNTITGITTINAVGVASTVSFFNNASSFNSVAVNASDGVTFDAGLSTNVGGITINADVDANDNIGTLSVAVGVVVSSFNNLLDVTANDLSVAGNLNSGTGPTSINDSDGDGIGLGNTLVAGGVNLSNTDLQNFSTNGLSFTTAGNIFVDGVTQPVSVGGTTSLLADGSITFSNGISSFNSLDARADDQIAVDVNLITVAGDLSLDGDANNVADTNDDIQFAAGVQLTSAGRVTLDATGAGMASAGALSLAAADGVTINDSLSTGGMLTVNADSDAGDGLGTFAIASGAAIATGNDAALITANDIVLQGTLDTGAASTLITDSDGSGIGMGDASVAGGLNVSTADAQMLTTSGLTLTTSGNITADGFVQPNSITGVTSVNAVGAVSSILFSGSTSSFGTLTVNATEGVSVASDLSTTIGGMIIDADSDANDENGTFTVGVGFTVDSGNGSVQVTANDFALSGDLNSGSSLTTLVDSDGSGFALGNAFVANGVNLNQAEMQAITSTGLLLRTGGNIEIDGIVQPNSIAGMTVLDAAGSVLFSNNASMFNSLDVQADDQVSVTTNVTTVVGDLTLDGDSDNSIDVNDNVLFTAGTQLASAGTLTLNATSGGMFAAGGLTLNAADGVRINDSLTTSGALVINSDTDPGDSDGTLTVASGAAVNTSNQVLYITANDLDFVGTINSGASTTTVTDSDGGGIGIGDAIVGGGINLANSDLLSLTAGGLTLQTSGDIVAQNVTQPNGVAGMTHLDAAGSVSFVNASSSFHSLLAQADDGITVNVNLTTVAGDLSIDGDADDSADTNDNVQFASGVQLGSAGMILLDATTGGMSGFGALTLLAADGVTVDASLTTGGSLTLNADTDAGDNTGTLTVSSGGAISTNNNSLVITANNLDLTGTISSGGAATTITDSDGNGIGLGDTPEDSRLILNGGELQNVSSNGLTFSTVGGITVNNIMAVDSAGIGGTTVLDAGSSIDFTTAASTFNALDARADDQVSVTTNVTTVVGDLTLDGDSDNSIDVNDNVLFTAGTQLASAGTLTLNATSGGMFAAGGLTLNAADGVRINDSLTTSGALVINSDTDPGDSDGTLTVASGAAVNTSNQVLYITANDLDFVGTINSGASTTTVTDSDGGGIGLGNTPIPNGLNVQASDFAQVTANGLVLATGGNMIVDNIIQPAHIGGMTTLNATGPTSSVSFQNNASTFNELTVNASQSVTVDASVTSQFGGIAIVAGGQVDVTSGRQLKAAGDGTSLAISAATLSLGAGASGSETIRNSGTGTISLTALAGNVLLGDHVVGGGSGTTTIGAAGLIDEAGNNNTVSVTTPGTLVLNAGGAIGETAGVGLTGNGALDLQVGTLIAQTFAAGGMFIRNAGDFILAGATTANGDVEIVSTGTMFVQGAVTSGFSGDVTLDGDNLDFSGAGDVTATSGNIAVTTSNPFGLAVANDAVFRTDQGQVSGQLLNAANPFAGTANIGDALSDTNRDAILNIVVADPLGSNVGVQIDWQEGDVVGPVQSTPPGDPRVQIVQSIVANPTAGATFVHTYENAPDPSNPSADINIALSVIELAGGSIDLFTAGQSVLLGTQFSAQTVVLEVSSPILPFFLSLPQTDDNERASQQSAIFVSIPEPQRTFVVEAPQVLNNSIGTTQQTDQRYYVLRIVTFGSDGEVKLMQGDQEYRLPDMEDADSEVGFELSQLPELFKRLPDDRYRIYMIEGQTERLVLDFIIRDGQPIEAQSDEQGPGSVQGDQEIEPSEMNQDDEPVEAPATRAPLSAAERLGSVPVLATGSVLLAARLVRNQQKSPQNGLQRNRTSPLSRKPA